eukprot:820067-Pyramimonas_sp.AAC.1
MAAESPEGLAGPRGLHGPRAASRKLDGTPPSWRGRPRGLRPSRSPAARRGCKRLGGRGP